METRLVDSGKNYMCLLLGPNPEHMDEEFLATAYPKVHENLKLITDERVIDEKPESHSGFMSSTKNLDDTFNFRDQFLHDKPTEDEQEKSKVREESDSTIPDSSHQDRNSLLQCDCSSQSLQQSPHLSLKITPFIALQLIVAKLEQEMSEVKKTDHSDVLASIRSQVPTAVDSYLGTKLDDALHKNLEKSPKEIIGEPKGKKMRRKKQDSNLLHQVTDKVDLEEFDLKSALSADEDAMDKEVADKVKDHKRKHDTPPPLNTPLKADDQSSKKPRESEASSSKQHPTLTSTGWQITDTREAGVVSSMHRSDPESEHSEQSSDDILK
ncbi:hypothetical protein Tco_1345162 [Tanacetum coccineum]